MRAGGVAPRDLLPRHAAILGGECDISSIDVGVAWNWDDETASAHLPKVLVFLGCGAPAGTAEELSSDIRFHGSVRETGEHLVRIPS